MAAVSSFQGVKVAQKARVASVKARVAPVASLKQTGKVRRSPPRRTARARAWWCHAGPLAAWAGVGSRELRCGRGWGYVGRLLGARCAAAGGRSPAAHRRAARRAPDRLRCRRRAGRAARLDAAACNRSPRPTVGAA